MIPICVSFLFGQSVVMLQFNTGPSYCYLKDGDNQTSICFGLFYEKECLCVYFSHGLFSFCSIKRMSLFNFEPTETN